MSNVQVRLSDKVVREIASLGKTLGSSKSEVIRRAVDKGLSNLKAELALEDYIKNKVTLCKAAVLSGLSVREFAEYAAQKGIPFMRYREEEARADLNRLRKAHESAD